jgi:hypothetical protein
MEFGKMIGDSFAYAKEGVIENKNKWFMLIIATLLIELPLMGYIVRILRGEKPAPAVENWGELFIDGIKLFIVYLIYLIPVIIIYAIMMVIMGAAFLTGGEETALAGMAVAGLLGLILFVLYIIIALLLPIAAVRFARTGSIGEGLNFRAVLAHIGKIGWISYIIALIIGGIVVAIPIVIIEVILMVIMGVLTAVLSYIGMLIGFVILGVVLLIVAPVIAVFYSRYITQIYDSIG